MNFQKSQIPTLQTTIFGGGFMGKRFGSGFFAVVAVIGLLGGVSNNALAQTGCPEEPGVERALCNAYCENSTCLDPNIDAPGLKTACNHVKDAYVNYTGKEKFPCEELELTCPCWGPGTPWLNVGTFLTNASVVFDGTTYYGLNGDTLETAIASCELIGQQLGVVGESGRTLIILPSGDHWRCNLPQNRNSDEYLNPPMSSEEALVCKTQFIGTPETAGLCDGLWVTP